MLGIDLLTTIGCTSTGFPRSSTTCMCLFWVYALHGLDMYIYSADVNTQRLRSSPPPPTHKPTNVRQAAHHFTNVISL